MTPTGSWGGSLCRAITARLLLAAPAVRGSQAHTQGTPMSPQPHLTRGSGPRMELALPLVKASLCGHEPAETSPGRVDEMVASLSCLLQ